MEFKSKKKTKLNNICSKVIIDFLTNKQHIVLLKYRQEFNTIKTTFYVPVKYLHLNYVNIGN